MFKALNEVKYPLLWLVYALIFYFYNNDIIPLNEIIANVVGRFM